MGSHDNPETYYRIGQVEQRWDHENILGIVSPHLMANTMLTQCGTSLGGIVTR